MADAGWMGAGRTDRPKLSMINWGSAPDPVPTRLSIAFEVEPVCSEFLADRKNLLADLSLANYYLINDPDLVVAQM